MSIPTEIEQSWRRNPEKIAIAFGEQSWSYAEFDGLTDNIAANFQTAGLEPGDRIAFHLLNGPELALAYIGCLKAGCIAVPVNTRLKGPEIDYILRHSGSVCYVGQPELYKEAEASCPVITTLELRYLTGDASAESSPSFASLLRPPSWRASFPEVAPDHVAAILYTSGTTARPKGVTHTHRTLIETARAMRQMRLDQDQIAVVISSMAHLVGFGMMFLSSLLTGASIVITRPFEFEAVLRSFSRWGSTYVFGLPLMLQGLLEAQIATPHDVSAGRFYFAGGDSVSPALQRAAEPVLGTVCEAYGATEIAPASWNQPGQVRVGSIGLPGVGVRFRLVDAAGRDVEPGQMGEIYVRGPHLAVGYWQDPDATSAAFGDGWFHTGDLACCDAEGYYWFAGRKKEIIIRGGSNISPQEVEAVLCDHPAVAEAAVVGLPDPVWGEALAAYVVLRPQCGVTEAALIAFASERLADYKLPESVVFRSELPKGPTGKVQRRALRTKQQPLALGA
jgi:long-chain acyl-CoA synthetase